MIYFVGWNIPLILTLALAFCEGEAPTLCHLTVKREMARPLKFLFQFPPIHGVFDAGYGAVYVFGGLHESEIENIIVHETLHYVLLRVVGKKASLRLDRIYSYFDDP